MDTLPRPISVSSLAARLGGPHAPRILDVRRAAAFEDAQTLIASATWRDPAEVDSWARYLPRDRTIVSYCAQGHEIGKEVCRQLREAGLTAHYLEGGFEAWTTAGGLTLTKDPEAGVPSRLHAPSRWITRERPKIDRIACPWLIRRFIDAQAEFLYVPAGSVLSDAAAAGATPYDIPGVRFTHRGERCSFDAFLDDFGLADPRLDALANIIRAADTGHPERADEAPGLLAMSLGLSALHGDDHVMLEHGLGLYDALFAWLSSAQGETHNAALFEAAR